MPIALDVLTLRDELTAQLPYDEKLIGNPVLPALHGGAIGAFLEMLAAEERITAPLIRAGVPDAWHHVEYAFSQSDPGLTDEQKYSLLKEYQDAAKAPLSATLESGLMISSHGDHQVR